MPPVEEPGYQQDEAPVSKSTKIGIIYPPPEVRNIVDKTASFVARNGPEFETRIRQNELNNPKFNFLNPNDPYNAYYQYKVKDFREGKGQEPAAPKLVPDIVRRQEQQVVQLPEPIVPKEPPPEFEFIADPPSISAFDLDVVKLTAQFVARNGRQFLTNLMNREKNYQFDFLRPQHSLFNYFTKLVEQYTKVLIPPKDLLAKLRKEADMPGYVLDQVKYRVEWAKFQDREKKKEEEALEKERVAYAQIDWHDFVVVETVDFQPNEPGNFPPPTTPEEVGARLLAQERFESNPIREDETVEMEVSSDEDDSTTDEEADVGSAEKTVKPPKEHKKPAGAPPPAPPQQGRAPPAPSGGDKVPPPPPPSEAVQPPPLPPAPDAVIVKKDYDPKAPKKVIGSTGDQFLISPITGEKIPVDKMQEHMRIALLDPKWIEQRDRQVSEKREQEEVYAAGTSIGGNLKLLAERRTDIFGSGAEEAQIGKKIGEEEKKQKEKVTWDGHTASMERVTQKARENISIEEQIHVIHKVKGLLPDEEKEKIGPKGPALPKSAPPLPPMPVGQAPGMPSSAASTSVPGLVTVPLPPKLPTTTQSAPARPPVATPLQPVRPVMVVQQQPPTMMALPPRPPIAPPRPPMMIGFGGPMPPQMPPRPMGGYMMQQPPQMPQQPSRPSAPSMDKSSDEPPAKKSKTEDDLIPENDFLKTNPPTVTFKVAVPKVADKPEWKLGGQVINLSLPLADSVSVIKAKLHEELGMPAGKQKLQHEGIFIKDSNTLAYYNFMRGCTVQLQVKERGGRKK